MGLRINSAKAPGSRHFNRLRLGVPSQLVLTHETCDCLIDDISATGARLRIARPLTGGQPAILSFHELKVMATVIWARADECGLRFDRRLDPEDMKGMLWIQQNRALYDRICREGHAQDWADGRGGD